MSLFLHFRSHMVSVMAGKKSDLGPTGITLTHTVRALREARNLSYAELSRRLADRRREIPPLGLRRIESGERRVDVDDLLALAVALEVSPVTLLMPVEVGESDPVQVTGLTEPAAAIGVWEWLRGRLARPGLARIRVDTWPSWEQEKLLGQFAEQAADGNDQ